YALRRPGRFDYELRIGAPSSEGRRQILNIHSRHMPLEQVDLFLLARKTHGFSGADLMNLCREAAYQALRRTVGEARDPASVLAETHPAVTQRDFDAALRQQSPSLLREFAVEKPAALSWEDVGGLESIKRTLMEEVVRAIRNPGDFAAMGIRPVRGVLLYGPPGTGKTLLAKVIAAQAETNFISVRGPEMLSMWFGESEKRIREVFARAREVSPCIVFFDEIDAITAQRGKNTADAADRLVNQLLTEMDSVSTDEHVCIVAATNRKDILDPALLRPGRFDYQILVPLPEQEERRRIFDIHLRGKPLAPCVDVEELAGVTRKLSGAHIEEITRRAGLRAMRESEYDLGVARITQAGLMKAVEEIQLNVKYLEQRRPIGFGNKE
ncbi:AAA family ATPase, partial [bacterium]|nr:AAA family ATPase [candidate division CSSED10-310 bacterium]